MSKIRNINKPKITTSYFDLMISMCSTAPEKEKKSYKSLSVAAGERFMTCTV